MTFRTAFLQAKCPYSYCHIYEEIRSPSTGEMFCISGMNVVEQSKK